MKATQSTLEARKRQHLALASMIGSNKASDGLKLYRKLRRIETEANAAATAQCNGKSYGRQPFRPDWHADGSEGTEENPTPYEVFCDSVRAKVAKAFGGTLPQGFRFNQDPRGYSLKLDPQRAPLPAGIVTDWGGYGILAPEIK